MQDSYTVIEAAPVLQLRPTTVQAHISRGNIQAQKRGGANFIPRHEIERFIKERRTKGQKKRARITQFDL